MRSDAAVSPALLEFFLDDAAAPAASLRQGRVSAIGFAGAAERGAFVDRLFLCGEDGAAPEPAFTLGRHRCLRRLPLHQIGLVSRAPTVLGQLSVRDNLGLVEDRPGRHGAFWPALGQALWATGLLAGIGLDTRAGALPWTSQVELNFLQVWLCEPECLMFDQLFDEDDAAALLRLPALFRRRFPLRAVCHLRQRGALPAALGVTDWIALP